jgi:hypothetical protein
VATGEVGQKTAGLGERDGVTPPARLVPERLGDHRLADTDGPVQDHGLAGFDKAQAGEVADARRWDLRVELEVEVLYRAGLLEVGRPHPPGDARRVTTG